MFWIGLFVGIIITVIAAAVLYWASTKTMFKSVDEWSDVMDVVYDALINRESELVVRVDGENLNSVTLEDW
jgi:hypothetical protein